LQRINADYYQKKAASTFEMGRDNGLHQGWMREWLVATVGTLKNIFATELEANTFYHTPAKLRPIVAGENVGWCSINNRMADFMDALRGILDMTTRNDSSPTFNVEHAYGSIIGTQENATLTSSFDLRALDVEID